MENPNPLIPNSTQVPNIVIDRLMSSLPDSELKCLLYICRRTYGFRRNKDQISLNQFIYGISTHEGKVLDYGTGLSRPVVVEGLKNLTKAEIIFVEKNSLGNIYSLNLDCDIEKSLKKVKELRKAGMVRRNSKPKQSTLFGGVVRKPNQLGNLTGSSKVNKPIVVRKPNSQYKGELRETKYLQTPETSAHKQLVEYWFDLVQKTRGLKPVITGANAKNLKRILDLQIAEKADLEKLFLYYLASPRFKGFSPDLSICLSAGVINTLINVMRHDGNFWKDLDYYATEYKSKAISSPQNFTDMAEKLEKLKAKLAMDFKHDKQIQTA